MFKEAFVIGAGVTLGVYLTKGVLLTTGEFLLGWAVKQYNNMVKNGKIKYEDIPTPVKKYVKKQKPIVSESVIGFKC